MGQSSVHVRSLPTVVRFVAHWLVLSVALIPLVFVVSVLDVGHPWVVAGACLGPAAIAVDRGVPVRTTGGFSLAAIVCFFLLRAATVGTFDDASATWTVGTAAAAYVVAVVLVRADLGARVRGLVDPVERGRSRD